MGLRDLCKGRAGEEQPQGTDSPGELIFLCPAAFLAPLLWGALISVGWGRLQQHGALRVI